MKDLDRGFRLGSERLEYNVVQPKMLGPNVDTRVVEPSQDAALVEGSGVTALKEVAIGATVREIRELGRAAVLLADYVVDLKSYGVIGVNQDRPMGRI